MGEAHYQFHAMDFLDYSYLQIGQEGKARQVVEDLDKVPGRSDDVITNVRVNLTTRNLLELHRWKEALAVAPEGDAFDQQMIFSLKTIAAARMDNVKGAEENFKNLKKAAKQERRRDEHVDRSRREEAEAWMEFAKGKHEKALKKMRAIADRQDRDDPGSFIVPAREMLADMLLELHQGSAALSEYEAVLKLVPNRFNANSYYSRLRENCPAPADREELQHVKTVAAGSQ
jgi:tetratricopeptide (TPR) repeat protein